MKCPSCESPLVLSASLIDEEQVSLRITWEGDFVEARTIGGIIENTRKLLIAAAKDVGGNYAVMMNGIEWLDKEAIFHFLVVAKPRKATTP